MTNNCCQTNINLLNSDESNAIDVLQNIRIENPNQLTNGYFNINSITNKFEIPSSIISSSMDIIMVSEIKLEESFSNIQFLMLDFANPNRFNGMCNGVGFKNSFSKKQVKVNNI